MAGKYDEDVYENPYYLKIMSDHPEYLEKTVASKGILCVPKYSIASSWTPTVQDIEDHILLPTKDSGDDDDDFITVSRKIVCISDGNLVTKDGFPVSRQVQVLFAETFHTDGGGSYRVLCIDGLLNKTVEKTETGNSTKAISPTSYRQCLELLWSHSGGHKMRDSLDKLLNTFAVTYDRLEGETLRSIVDVANTHFTKAMQLLLKDSVVRKSVQRNPHYMDNLKVAVETYVMNSVHKNLFRVITTAMAGHDAEINKINRNLIHLQFSDLGIRQIFSQNIPFAKKELNLLNRYSTPMGRLFCLKRVVAALTRPPKSASKESTKETVAMMTTDDLLPILIFIIIKSEIPNWMANLVYMHHFHFAKSSDDDEFGFYLASLEAALEHIKSGNINDEIKPLKREHWSSFLVSDSTDSPSPVSTVHSPSRQLSHSSLDDFFRYVQAGDEKKVLQMLERPYKTSEEVHLKMCHPLCSCDKCDKLLSDFRSNSDLVTAYTRDNRGYTALHIAAYYGQALLIDLLIQNSAIVDATDYLGLTPLHLACQRGYQNVMLLLLHFGADVTATDNEGNSPLHLCCANGHEDCVKALVFYEASLKRLQINMANEFGDTALHLAAKWGYETIVKTLLENGADATLGNRRKQTPVHLAQNVKVQRWLQLAAEDPDFQPIKPQQFVSSKARSRASSTASSSSTQNSTFSSNRPGRVDLYEPHSSSISIETTSLEVVSDNELKRKKEKLFKAVIEGDIQLVKFYLGIQSEADEEKDDEGETLSTGLTLDDMCHPLCQCNRCSLIQKATKKSGNMISVNTKTSTGYCLIHMAVLHNHKDIVAFLISHGAEVNVLNHKSLTPLHLAVCTHNTTITDILVKAGARLDIHDINGDTPLLIAASNGFNDGVQILIKEKADVNAVNQRGNTSLHEAVIRDNSATATALLDAGADPRIKNKHGKLPQEETYDQPLIDKLVAACQRLEEAERISKNNNNLSHGPSENEGQVSIRELFSAFEENDLHKLQSLASGIRSFDQRTRLRRTETKDKSAPSLDALTQKRLILTFDRRTLRKTSTVYKCDPRHNYALSRSKSVDTFFTKDNSLPNIHSSFDDTLTPLGDNSLYSGFNEPLLTPLPELDISYTHGPHLWSDFSARDMSTGTSVLDDAALYSNYILSTSADHNLLTSDIGQSDTATLSDTSKSLESQSINLSGICKSLESQSTDTSKYLESESTDLSDTSKPLESQSTNVKYLSTTELECSDHSVFTNSSTSLPSQNMDSNNLLTTHCEQSGDSIINDSLQLLDCDNKLSSFIY